MKYFYHAVLEVDGEDNEIFGIIEADDAIEAFNYIDHKLQALAKSDRYQLRAFNNVK